MFVLFFKPYCSVVRVVFGSHASSASESLSCCRDSLEIKAKNTVSHCYGFLSCVYCFSSVAPLV